jgi:Na+-translocating ferredoxin:NAD+ oxidoreductase RnfG subunit
MTTTQVIIIVAVIAVISGLIMARVRRPRETGVERKPPPRRDPDA